MADLEDEAGRTTCSGTGAATAGSHRPGSTSTPAGSASAPTAGIITQPTEPVDPDNSLFPEQTVFPLDNFGISDTPYNWDYCFRAGIFCGDYEGLTIGTDNKVWAMWTDARNGRSSRVQTGRNPICEQSDAWADTYRDSGQARRPEPPEKQRLALLADELPDGQLSESD